MNTPRLVVVLATLALLIPTLTACTGLQGASADGIFAREDKGRSSSDGFPGPSQAVVWQSAVQAVKEQGYVVDPEVSSSTDGMVESRWKLSLQPFAGQGFREKVSVQIMKVRGRPNFFRVDTHVMRQKNDNMTQPSSAIAAEWASGSRNASMERLINNQVEMMFMPGDVSDEYRRKNNMRGAGSPRDPSVKPPPPKPSMLEGMGIDG